MRSKLTGERASLRSRLTAVAVVLTVARGLRGRGLFHLASLQGIREGRPPSSQWERREEAQRRESQWERTENARVMLGKVIKCV